MWHWKAGIEEGKGGEGREGRGERGEVKNGEFTSFATISEGRASKRQSFLTYKDGGALLHLPPESDGSDGGRE